MPRLRVSVAARLLLSGMTGRDALLVIFAIVGAFTLIELLRLPVYALVTLALLALYWLMH